MEAAPEREEENSPKVLVKFDYDDVVSYLCPQYLNWVFDVPEEDKKYMFFNINRVIPLLRSSYKRTLMHMIFIFEDGIEVPEFLFV